MRRSRRDARATPPMIDTSVMGDAATSAHDQTADSDSPAAFHATDPMWTTLSAAGMATVVLSADLHIEWTNPPFADMLGTDVASIVGMPLLRALGAGPQDHLIRSLRHTAENPAMVVPRLSIAASDASGAQRELALSAARTGLVPNGFVAFVEDLTAARRTADASSAIDDAVAATQDSLTRIPNRLGFEAQVHSSLRRAAGGGEPFAVLLCDIDDFSGINARHGEAVGDQVLNWVARRLTHTLRHHDTLARLGNDQFVVIAEKVPDENVSALVARRLVNAVADPMTIDDHDIRVSMCVGSTVAKGLERATDLLIESDRALQSAKATGHGTARTLADARASQVMPTDSILPDAAVPTPHEAAAQPAATGEPASVGGPGDIGTTVTS